MSLLRSISAQVILILMQVFLGGCAQEQAPPIVCSAVVDRIEPADSLGTRYYTVADGEVTAYFLYLRLDASAQPPASSPLKVLVLGLRQRERCGNPGDRVVFRLPAPVPPAGGFSLDRLGDYQVVPPGRAP